MNNSEPQYPQDALKYLGASARGTMTIDVEDQVDPGCAVRQKEVVKLREFPWGYGASEFRVVIMLVEAMLVEATDPKQLPLPW